MEIKELYGVEYYPDFSDETHTTFELFKSFEDAETWANSLKKNEKIEIFKGKFNMAYVWEEDKGLQYEDVSDLWDWNREVLIKY